MMAVQQTEWSSQSLSEERQQNSQQQLEEHNHSSQLQPNPVDFARPESPSNSQLPEFPLPSTKSHTGPSALRTSFRENVRSLNQVSIQPIMHRRRSSSSFSSVSIITNALSSGLANAHPAPAYVGPFGATQAVSEYQARIRLASKKEEETSTKPSAKEDVAFSPPALALLNGFLDQLLFSFLAHAQSTSLVELRPAVKDVLRPRLAGEAIASADEELQELIGNGNEEEEERKKAGEDNEWDLELVWKRTRLRVMVYIRLGDMEDDDEQRYASEENHSQDGLQRFSQSTGLVSWAAAIFLTSVLEYVAEQVLQVAGQIAIDRARTSALNSATSPNTEVRSGDLTVGDTDMERVALNSGLSRLWRKWRKAQRNSSSVVSSPQTPSARHTRRQYSIGNVTGSIVSPRRSSFGTALESPESRRESLDTARETPDDDRDDIPDADYPEYVIASNIPLPLGDEKTDIDEIEVPGLARDPDEPNTSLENKGAIDVRRSSFSGPILSWVAAAIFGTNATDQTSDDLPKRPEITRQRSSSVPAIFHASSARKQEQQPLPSTGQEDTEEAAHIAPTADTVPAGTGISTQQASDTDAAIISQRGVSGQRFQKEEQRDVDRPAAAVAITTIDSHDISHAANGNLADTEQSPVAATSQDLQSQVPAEAAVPLSKPAHADYAVTPPVHGSTLSDPPEIVSSSDKTATIDGSLISTPFMVESQETDHGDRKTQSPVSDTENQRTPPPADKNNSRHEDSQEVEATPAKLADPIVGYSTANIATSPVSQVSSLGELDGRVSPNLSKREFIETAPLPVSPESTHLERRRTPSPNEHNRFSEPVLSNRHNALNSAIYSTAPEVSSFQSSPAPLAGRNSLQAPSSRTFTVPESSSAVQEHPVVQRIASLKYKDVEKTQPLTSASIKGPEDFEMFVQGGDTVKYTLTPENVRDEPTSYHASSPTGAAPPIESRTGRSSIIRQALGAIPDPIMESTFPFKMAAKDNQQPNGRPYVYNTSASRRSGLMAREPRVMTESTRDFADFIRSTGPDREPQPINLLTSKSSSALPVQNLDSTVPTRAGSFGGLPSRGLIQTDRPSQVPPLPSGKSKTSMQPRAATSISGGSADLIDFIRNGPNQAREHRISRTVAPFRTTMDSEQLNDWSDQLLSQPELALATGNATTMHKQSISSVWSSNQASANSRSALLANTEMSLQSKASSSKIKDTDPTRKSYRNKDPYALPSDDDDDDFITNHVPKRNEESMVDFLRNTDPPVDNAPKRIQQSNNNAVYQRSMNVGGDDNMVNIFANSRSKSIPGVPVLKISTTARAPAVRGPVSAPPRTKLEARSPGTPIRDTNHDSAIHNDTGDLADFLRNSGPPTDMRIQRDPFNVPAPAVAAAAAAATAPVGRLSKQQPPPKAEKDRSGRRSIFGSGFFGRGAKKV